MGIFDFLFGKPKTTTAPQPASAPSRGNSGGLQYNPAFIPQLKHDHQSLLELFGAIGTAQQAGDFVAVKQALQQFQAALNMHLAVENAQFYAYLRKTLTSGTPAHQTMTAFWDEMQDIGKVVTQFLRKYIGCDFTPEVRSIFGSELEQIGAALVSRIEREEKNLYSLYLP